MELEKRQIDQYIWDQEIVSNKMIFLSGPRQVGKTTYAKSLLQENQNGVYCNWDSPETRKKYTKDSYFFLENMKGGREFLTVFDEIHKRLKWKDILKGIFDTVDPKVRIFVTGSARMDLFRKSGDSLVGRYVQYRMFPASLSELLGNPIENLWLCNKEDWNSPWNSLLSRLENSFVDKSARNFYEDLFRFGGFPEPLTKGSERFLLKWKKDYLSLMLTEDLRELTNIKAIDTVERIVDLLPERVGSPLSIQSLARDVESSHPTVKNHLSQLERLWILFGLRPWAGKLNRTLKKEQKQYFTNWIYASKEATVFENLLATLLYRACSLWTEIAYGEAELYYIRNFDGREIDFLIVLNGKPILAVEAKMSKTEISKPARNFKERLGVPLIQVVNRPGIFRRNAPDEIVVSAERFLSLFP